MDAFVWFPSITDRIGVYSCLPDLIQLRGEGGGGEDDIIALDLLS